MAKYGPASGFLLVGGLDLSGDTFEMEEGFEQRLSQANGLGDSWEEHLPVGVSRVLLEAGAGLYDDRTAGNLDAYQEMGSTRQVISFGPAGHAIGTEAIHCDGDYAVTWRRVVNRDDLTMGYAVHRISGSRLVGVILHDISSESGATGDTESSPVDNTSSSSDGATADLHIPALTLGGYTSVTVKVRHSTDDITYSDLITFTAATAVGAERKTVAGTINRYLAMSWAFNGSGSAQSVTPYVVINRG